MVSLANALLSSKDERLRDAPRALLLAERACNGGYRTAFSLWILARGYAAARRYDDALETAREGLARAGEEDNEVIGRKLERVVSVLEQSR